MKRYPPISLKAPYFLHGADYNPDQWSSEVWDKDIELMKECHCNTMTLGIFSWAQLEPREGQYTFEWLDTIMDKLAERGYHAILATPTAAQPAWMSKKYPDVLRTGEDRRRCLHGNRLNHCLSSPIYRTKCAGMAEILAHRYGQHPALILWHVSNEYNNPCYCANCQNAFREWLKARYQNIEALNAKWWTAFWGHSYSEWDEIEAPGQYGSGHPGEWSIQGLSLDWKRFSMDQIIDCYSNEANVLKRITPGIPVTTNTYTAFYYIDPRKLVHAVDVVSWDCYPQYHDRSNDWLIAVEFSWIHDLYRAYKGGKPFMLMESTPSSANWMNVMKLKRPGVHKLTSLQAIAHGADTVQYFQWRQGRGGHEQYHGAVVSHTGDAHTRVFKDVQETGATLKKLDPIIGTTTVSEVAIIYDRETHWALDNTRGPRREKKNYIETNQQHYQSFWKHGLSVDIIHMDADFSGYKLLIAPMLYLLRPGVAERICQFVRRGGTFVTSYLSGKVDECSLVFEGGMHQALQACLGIWAEEIDALYDDETNRIRMCEENELGLHGEYEAHTFCDLIHVNDATAMAVYKHDFYSSQPALTVNRYGKGSAYYMAARTEQLFLDDFYQSLIRNLKIGRNIHAHLPEGVTAQRRTDGERSYLFLLNFTAKEQTIELGKENGLVDVCSGETRKGHIDIPAYGAHIYLIDSN